MVITYFAFVAAGKVTGNGKNDITVHEYMMRVQDISDPVYDYNLGKELY